MSPPLRRYWFEFEIPDDADCPPGARAGVGVTAVDRADALTIVASRILIGRTVPAVRHEIEDIVFHRLCPWLVLPNMVDPGPRGVLFPVGYGGQ